MNAVWNMSHSMMMMFASGKHGWVAQLQGRHPWHPTSCMHQLGEATWQSRDAISWLCVVRTKSSSLIWLACVHEMYQSLYLTTNHLCGRTLNLWLSILCSKFWRLNRWKGSMYLCSLVLYTQCINLNLLIFSDGFNLCNHCICFSWVPVLHSFHDQGLLRALLLPLVVLMELLEYFPWLCGRYQSFLSKNLRICSVV